MFEKLSFTGDLFLNGSRVIVSSSPCIVEDKYIAFYLENPL